MFNLWSNSDKNAHVAPIQCVNAEDVKATVLERDEIPRVYSWNE